MDENGNRTYTDEEMQEYLDINTEEDLTSTDSIDNENDIETQITNFQKISEELEKSINEFDNTLTLSNGILDSKIDVEKITSNVEKLHDLYQNIVEGMRITRLTDKEAKFSMFPSDIVKTVEKNKRRLKKLKTLQIDKYNARVDATNKKIEDLKNKTDLEAEVVTMIEGLNPLDRCELKVTDWKYNQHTKSIDYDKVLETEKLIANIDEKLNIKRPSPVIEGLDADIEFARNNVTKLETEITEDMPEKDINDKAQELANVRESVDRFATKLGNSKNDISEDLYNIYLDEYEELKEKITKLKEILGKKKKHSNDYDRLEDELENILKDVTNISEELDTNRGVLTEDWISERIDTLSKLDSSLSDAKKDVEDRNTEGKLDKQQYENLTTKANGIKTLINDTKDKLLDPGMIKGADIYGVLNDDIKLINNKIKSLATQVKNLDKPIKDKETRKLVDEIIKELEKRIKRLEKTLSQYKNDDPEKYNATLEELNKTKEKLNEVSGEYRKKCPLMVKSVKSAKHLYKKYKKQALIIAGIAAFALVSNHVLIPAIMHGNMMIWQTVPALRNFIQFTNRILGGMIGATEIIENVWILSNGISVNSSVAATSLLKGLAISGIGSTALVAPVIVAIKKLVTKMNLKQKMIESYEKRQVKVAENKKTRKKKKEENSRTKEYINNLSDLSKLLKLLEKYYKSNEFKSGITIEKYCENLDLSETEKAELISLEKSNQEKLKSKRKG